jgi:carbamoyl-phosphate synthase large subunit
VTKTILILGAGVCQVPLIRKARALGYRVLVASIPGPYPGFQAADKAYYVDVRDAEQILRIARAESVCAVLTDQTDIPVLTAAFVAERLGLPGIGMACARRFTNKKAMREACAKLGVPSPQSYASGSLPPLVDWVNEIGYPVIVKPVDNQGSRGVRRVDDKSELQEAFEDARRHSAVGEVLAEEFVAGREIVIEGFASNRQFTNLVIGDRSYFDISGRFIPQATLFPSNLAPALQQRLCDLNERLVTGLGLPFGITHSEFLVDPLSGQASLVEIAARGGGVFISSDLVPLACGTDVNELLISVAVGETVSSILRPSCLASGYLCFSLPEGIIVDPPNISEIAVVPGVHRAYLDDLTPGRVVHAMQDKTMRLGPILIRAADRAELDRVAETVRRTLKVGVSTPDGPKGPVWQ